MATNNLEHSDIAVPKTHTGTPMNSASKTSSQTDLASTKQEENKEKTMNGRTAGGSFLNDLGGSNSDNPDQGPLKEVDFDLPLTLQRVCIETTKNTFCSSLQMETKRIHLIGASHGNRSLLRCFV